MNKLIISVATLAAALSLSACGGKGDDAAAANAQAGFENMADSQDDMADNATNGLAEDAYEANAAALREQGEDVADSIDDNDINAQAAKPK